MCLGVPAKVIKVGEGFATVDMAGVERDVATVLLEETPLVGEYVLVHVGFAISKLGESQALETLKFLKEFSDEIY
jgi:hydrogenase expression/formation protein HypC